MSSLSLFHCARHLVDQLDEDWSQQSISSTYVCPASLCGLCVRSIYSMVLCPFVYIRNIQDCIRCSPIVLLTLPISQSNQSLISKHHYEIRSRTVPNSNTESIPQTRQPGYPRIISYPTPLNTLPCPSLLPLSTRHPRVKSSPWTRSRTQTPVVLRTHL